MKRVLPFLLLPFASIAQDTNELRSVIISDNRIETSIMESGRNVQVLTQDQIETMPAQNLNDLLQHIAGVDFRQRGAWGAQADVSLRGGTFDQTLILVNGIKMNDPQTGHHNLNLGIDVSSIRQIEVIKGPAAARYGLNTFSGVINIITKPTDENQAVVRTIVGQSEDAKWPNAPYAGYQAEGAVNFGGDKSRHLVSVSRTQSGGYRENTDLNRNTAFYQGNMNSKVGEFNVMAMAAQNDFGASGFYAYPIDASSEEQVSTIMGAVQHAIRFGPTTVRSKVYSRKNFDTYTLFRDQPEIFQNRHRTDVEGGEIHVSHTYAQGTLGAGLEYRHEAINSNNLGLRVRDNYGAFLEHRLWLLNEHLSINTGAYINNSTDFGTQILPSASMHFSMNEHFSLFANAGQSFRIPTFTDLYYVGPTNIGNADLKPEQSTNYETGVKFNEGLHFFQVSAFRQLSNDLIDWVRDSISEPWRPENYETVVTNGVEVNYEMRSMLPIVSSDLSFGLIRLGYTYLDMNITSAEEVLSRYALNNLRHQVSAQGVIAFKKNLSLSLTGRYLDRQSYKSYWLADVRLQYARNNIKTWIDATNMLNTDYIEAANAPMPGRWFRLGLEWTIPY